jgi:hypothetical protein
MAGMTKAFAVLLDQPEFRMVAKLFLVVHVDRRLPFAIRTQRMPPKKPAAESLPGPVIQALARSAAGLFPEARVIRAKTPRDGEFRAGLTEAGNFGRFRHRGDKFADVCIF